MQIINNRPGPNHRSKVADCFKCSDEIIIVSPFISADLSFFPFDELRHLKKITLITRLREFTRDQYEKVGFFVCLYEFGKEHSINIEILIDNVLHGKVYIGSNKGKFREAIITSANFNKFGLEFNNEWGVCINEESLIEQMAVGLFDRITLQPLTEEEVKVFKKELEKTPIKKGKKEVDLNLEKLLKKKPNPLQIPVKTIYWLKPIGVTGDIIPWGESFNSFHSNLHFSKRPTGIKQGHIIIAYAVGHRNILSVYRVVSDFKPSGSTRWPYFIIGENLTPYYGDQWHLHKITITNQKDEVLAKKLFNITPSGMNCYGSLMRSADKLNITSEFGKFLIDKVQLIDQKIAETQ
ncbi:restriction endonuclease PLD domain-containing protein [uncultured Mucilaginibacter sp.]|uniref:restriction endonuclease PLD domain-containing protein n=1 Tax=uncultured Mucilaginibacter sp. TaxID=797541 RepID=UPI0025EFC74E|nr:restriction endonuclease PLD domain-containing protein [uncultured Mucilaginibacter sp.]